MPSIASCIASRARLARLIGVAITPALLVAASAASIAAQKQNPEWAPLLTRANAAAAAGDSMSALALLDSIVHIDSIAAPAWYRLGIIAWRLSQPDSSIKIDWTPEKLGWMQLADSSLRMAARLAPDSSRYQLTTGNFLLASELAIVRFQALSYFKKAVEAAERAGDTLALSESLDRAGMRYWRRYEPMAHRWMAAFNRHPDVARFVNDRRMLDNFLETQAWRMQPEPGKGDYLTATDRFRRALDANSSNTMARRHYFMSLIAEEQWSILRDIARQRTVDAEWDVWGWLALGLAQHRMDQDVRSTASFNRALSLMSSSERDFFTRLTRLLSQRDSLHYDSLRTNGKLAMERMFWMLADPMALVPGNESWLEFLSRVTYAELMWTVEEYGLRGAQTDRGQIYIRYGPPDREMAFQSSDAVSTQLIWMYDNGMVFYYRMAPGFGMATASFDSREIRDAYLRAYPSNFNNIGVFKDLYPIPVQIARFRAGPKTTSLWLAGEIPAHELTSGVDLKSGLFQTAVILFDRRTRVLKVDSSSSKIALQNVPNRRSSWRFELPATEELGYRIEALQRESNRGARAIGSMDLRHSNGFGMSDILVAAGAKPAVGRLVMRWTDLIISPGITRTRQGTEVSLVWETYDLASDSTNSSTYTVQIELERSDGSGLLRGIARVIEGTLGRGDGQTRNNQVSISFERRVPARPVTLDYLRLALRDLNPGEYRLTVTITDEITGRKTHSSRELTIQR